MKKVYVVIEVFSNNEEYGGYDHHIMILKVFSEFNNAVEFVKNYFPKEVDTDKYPPLESAREKFLKEWEESGHYDSFEEYLAMECHYYTQEFNGDGEKFRNDVTQHYVGDNEDYYTCLIKAYDVEDA